MNTNEKNQTLFQAIILKSKRNDLFIEVKDDTLILILPNITIDESIM